MPKYFPIDTGVTFDCSESDLLAVAWKTRSLSADFLLPGVEGRAVRVRFDEATIVRLVDEMPLSTEDQPTKNDGRIPRHFAYRVEGAIFAETQSWAWKEAFKPVCHYQFVTGSGCMDVLCRAVPSFEIIDISAPASPG